MMNSGLSLRTLPTRQARLRLKIPFAWVVAGLLGNLATAQTTASSTSTSKPSACPNPEQVEPVHLYGLWRGEVEIASQTISQTAPQLITVRFEKHPELSGSVMGTIQRGSVKSQCAGDVDNGILALEESSDGKSISATWTGNVEAGSCGKQISGTWNNQINNTSHKFVLRKATGWD